MGVDERTMTDQDDGSHVTLSRRKALAGLGTIGAAGALGIGGTYAQFTDTEQDAITFTAGGIDGTIEMASGYNGNAVEGAENLANLELEETGDGVGSKLHLTDVKPGDYGSCCFAITVENNPAWVGSCVGYSNNSDGTEYEPEVEAETGDPEHDPDQGELHENILMIPFYNDELVAEFFDSGWRPPNSAFEEGPDGDWIAKGDTPEEIWEAYQGYHEGTSPAFWDSREGENDCIYPLTLRNVAVSHLEQGTVQWASGDGSDYEYVNEPDGSDVGPGCVLLQGSLADGGNTAVDEQGVSPL